MASTHFWYRPTTGNGDTQITISADTTNLTGTTDKVATLTFTAGTASKTVTVRQRYLPIMTQFGSRVFPDTGGSIYFTVNTEYDIVFRSVPDWITIKKGTTTYTEGQRISSGAANGTFELVAAANTGTARTISSTMNMAHYIGDTVQNRYSYFSFSQKTSNRLLPLTFEILTGGTINFRHNRTLFGDVGNLTVQYQINNGTWTNLTSSTGGTSIQVASGDVVKFRGDNATYSTLPLSYTTFSGSTASFNLCGNIMSLIDSTGFTGMSVVSSEYCFNRLFANTRVYTAEDLVLPATIIAQHAYTSMFQDCIYLTKSPELPVPELTANCYDEMFNGCVRLAHIRCYATNISALNCTYNWVQDVAASGTFVKHTMMNDWTTGNNGIPTGWVVQSYTPTSVTKSIAILPRNVEATSAQTAATVHIYAENCNYSSMTYTTGGAFSISVASVQGKDVNLTFGANTGNQRVGTMAFILRDTEGNSYNSDIVVSQAGTAQTRNMVLSPTSATVSSASTGYTIYVPTTACTFSSMSYSSSNPSFPVTAEQNGSFIKLYYEVNTTGAERITNVNFALKDEVNNVYNRTFTLTQLSR